MGENEMKSANAINEESQIRGVIEDVAEALRAKDVDRYVSHYAEDIVLFDLAPPLEYAGLDALRKGLEEWFATFEGSIGIEIRNLRISVGNDTAFSHSLNHLTGERTTGEHTDVWFRSTLCFRKIEGKWLVVHEHSSVPLYMDGSNKAAVDLKPADNQ
jgi:uncharacterized protein (TIGR02246 family)